ncbi:MAG: CinA family protein [Candidatus Omnitrophota bacterium]
MIQRIVSQIHKLLIKNKKTMAVAESCTGGLLSSFLTHSSGSSRYFQLGVVAYSNNMKSTLLQVPPKMIEQKGAVSELIARRMAKSVRELAGTDFAIAITGIAGPTGGTPQKPIGTVFIAVSAKNKTICEEFHFTGNRTTIRNKSALKALELLKSFF